MLKSEPLNISAYTLTTALGSGIDANLQALRSNRSGLTPCNVLGISDLNTWVGEVKGLTGLTIDGSLSDYNCRNNVLADFCLTQDGFSDSVARLIKKYGATRIGVFIGTSTSGIRQTEEAYSERAGLNDDQAELPDWYKYANTHNLYSSAEFVRLRYGLQGPCLTISTACSSSAKVFASAQRAISSGLCDAALVGGVDSLCFTTLYGFNSLQVVSEEICRPSDVTRSGISIGEAAGFALLEKAGAATGEVDLIGCGESADAHHMSTPHPEGKGAEIAMRNALLQADIAPSDVDYINLHGTGTIANDLAESLAVNTLFGTNTACSSTKGWTGHTLGAAGIVEAIFSIFSIGNGYLPKSLNTLDVDPSIAARILLESESKNVQKVLSNSIGFGGSNCSLLFGKSL